MVFRQVWESRMQYHDAIQLAHGMIPMNSLPRTLLKLGMIAGFTVLSGVGVASASSPCGGFYGSCDTRAGGLVGLFRSDNASTSTRSEGVAQGRSFFLPYTAPKQDFVSAVTVPATAPLQQQKPASSPRHASLQREPDNFEPHQLPVYQGDTQLLVMRSENRQLSSKGHSTQAILMMRCRSGDLNVLLDFPGYPMSDDGNAKLVSYQLDNRQTKRTGFSTSNQLSVVGMWQSSQARKLAKEILKSNSMKLQTQDSENTKINARFNVDKIRSSAGAFAKKCGIS
jgi:hypothetical protein